MMEKDKGNLDVLLEELGCGKFQIILCIFVFILAIPSYWSIYFMTFGIYNPGWKCVDNTTTSVNGTSSLASQNTTSESDYTSGSCVSFETCNNIEFNPAASTIITDFGLVCDRSWVMSLTISLFMAGNTITFIFIGILGDKYGRKATVQAGMFLQAVLNLVSMYSTSWEMFAATEFLLGSVVSSGTLLMVMVNEFVPQMWRIRVVSLPTWTTSIVIFTLSAMLFRDWKILRLICCITAAVSFALMFWIPKTPRFLSASGRKQQFLDVLGKISKYNKTKMPEDSVVDLMMDVNSMENNRTTPYHIFSIFRRGYIMKSLVIGLSFMIIDMTYIAMALGISSLPGNLYVNMLILSLSELPGNLFAGASGNITGRRVTILVFSILGSVLIFSAVAFDVMATGTSKIIGTLVSLVMAKIFMNTEWYVMVTAVMEVYPTVVRGSANSYCRMSSMAGGIIAPYLVPKDPSTFYICYLVMGGLILLSGCIVQILPETRGKPLRDTWDELETVVQDYPI